MAQHFWLSGQTLVDGNGTPYASAKAYFYETGTTTPKATYSDAGLTSANVNPVVAGSDGRFPDIYLVAGRYKVVYKTSADVTIDTLDPVDGTAQIISAASAPATTYPFLVYHNTTDGNRYRRNAANNAWINEGPVDSLVSAASVSEVLVGTETGKAVTPDSLASLWQRGTDIASATTLSLPATGGGVFNVTGTGTTTINGISTGQGGRCLKLRFAGSWTLTHNATSFILPGAANITTSAGDCAEFINDAATDASGSNWRCFNYEKADGKPLVAGQANTQAATYTAATTDRGGVVVFSGLSADVTLNLPTASSFGAGQILYVRNNDATYGVTIDPSGSETLDGATTRRTNGPNTVVIMSTGTNWVTISGVYRYVSPEVAISAGASFGGTHGLGVMPYVVSAIMVCKTADAGYAIGDRVYIPGYPHGAGGTTTGCTVGASTTNAFGIISATNTVNLLHKTTGAAGAATTTNWRIVVECLAS